MDYGRFLDRVRQELEPLTRAADGKPLSGVSTAYTGIMPLLHAIQHELIQDLFKSFLSAFALITIVMTVVQGGILAGLVSMVSNLFPVVLLFGLLGWLDLPLDVGTVMTASIALGMAVDNTLHFLTFFRRGLDSGRTLREAVDAAYRHCGPAMVQSTLICSMGLLAFSFSAFVPVSRFVWMMIGLLFAGLAGDLIVLPALLLSPLGRLFRTPAPQPAWPEPPIVAEGDVRCRAA
jgi:predicted RND superfamily exporter protein